MRRWRLAVFASSFCNGFIFASWMARLPTVQENLGVDYGTLGVLLFSSTIGSFSAVTLAGIVVTYLGSKRVIQAGATLVGLGTCSFGMSVGNGNFWLAALSLLMIGCGQGSWSVAANVEGASCEVTVGKVLMPKLHGSFSVGTLAGAVLSFIFEAGKVPVAGHFIGVGIVTVVTVNVVSSYFKADIVDRDAHRVSIDLHERNSKALHPGAFDAMDPVEPVAGTFGGGSASPGGFGDRPGKVAAVLGAWKEPRTLALGFIVLGMALGEGAASDWIHISMVQTYNIDESWRVVGYVIFVAFMAAGRLSGTWVLQKFDRLAVIRSGASLAAIAITVFVFAPVVVPEIALEVSCVAIVFWALGISLGFPIVMNMAAEDSKNAAARVSVVSAIGYMAFLCGPPLLGFAADIMTVRYALLFVLIFVVVTFVVASKVRNGFKGPVASVAGAEKV